MAKIAIEIIDKMIEKAFPPLGSYVDAPVIRSIRMLMIGLNAQPKHVLKVPSKFELSRRRYTPCFMIILEGRYANLSLRSYTQYLAVFV